MHKYLDIPLTIAVMAILTAAMLWPIHQPPPAPAGADKLVHALAFTALAFPLARTGRFGLVVVFLRASAFGGVIELIQPTVGRAAELMDWIADVVGVIVGIDLGLVYGRVRLILPH